MDKNKTPAFTVDGGGNLHLGLQECSLDYKRCLCHLLCNVVHAALPEVEAYCAQIRNICTYFHTSIQAWTKLKTFQINESKLQGFRGMAYQLMQEVKNRWNSTFQMFQRYLLI